MNNILKYSGLVALVILAIMGLYQLAPSEQSVGTAVDCQSNTCFTTVGVLTSFQVDGSSIFNGSVALNGATTLSGSVTLSGATTLASTTITGLKVGNAGTQLSQVLSGTCNLIGTPSIAGTSTAPMDCSIPGVVVGDKVFMEMATTSKVAIGYWTISATAASSTSGFATALVANWTGATNVPPIGATSSVQYWIVR